MGWAILINTAAIFFQKGTRKRIRFPMFIAVIFRPFKILFYERPALHAETPRQSVDFLFTERRFYLPATVGAGSAIDSGPHPLCGLKDAPVDLVRIQVAPILQELSKSPVLILSILRQLAYVNKIEIHAQKNADSGPQMQVQASVARVGIAIGLANRIGAPSPVANCPFGCRAASRP